MFKRTRVLCGSGTEINCFFEEQIYFLKKLVNAILKFHLDKSIYARFIEVLNMNTEKCVEVYCKHTKVHVRWYGKPVRKMEMLILADSDFLLWSHNAHYLSILVSIVCWLTSFLFFYLEKKGEKSTILEPILWINSKE